jgi:hypothetical protein
MESAPVMQSLSSRILPAAVVWIAAALPAQPAQALRSAISRVVPIF